MMFWGFTVHSLTVIAKMTGLGETAGLSLRVLFFLRLFLNFFNDPEFILEG